MKDVIFESIGIKNFLSVGNEIVSIPFTPGVHIITGINKDKIDRRNGVGKSTIVDAVYFAVFGSTLRDLKKELIPNNITGDTCEVILEFKVKHFGKVDSYRVVRTLNPSKCYLFKNGDDVTRDSITNTSAMIEDIIKASPEVFKNCVLMTVNSMVPFMAKGKTDKRKFIEGTFGLEVFSKMLAVARSEYNDLKREYQINLTKLEEVNEAMSNYKAQRDVTLNTRSNKLEKYKRRKKDNANEISIQKRNMRSCTSAIAKFDFEDLRSKKSKLESGASNTRDIISTIVESIATARAQIRVLRDKNDEIGVRGHVCDKCLRPISDHDKEQIEKSKIDIAESISAHESNICTLETEKDTCTAKIAKIRDTIEKINAIIQRANLAEHKKISIEERIQQLEQWASTLDDDIKHAGSKKTDQDAIITETEARLEVISKAVDKHKGAMNMLDIVKYVVSEEGVKSYIVKKILQVFNSKLAYYLKEMDANCLCAFNEFFEEEIINDKHKICSYHNFSGAERKNIDFACLFTFISMRRLQGESAHNILFFDELFDSSLDEKGIEIVMDLLRKEADKHNLCVYIITHRQDLKIDTVSTITLEKENGITTFSS